MKYNISHSNVLSYLEINLALAPKLYFKKGGHCFFIAKKLETLATARD
jgi:hypothetical protein